MHRSPVSSLFFFNDTATTEIYTLSLHDALPIYRRSARRDHRGAEPPGAGDDLHSHAAERRCRMSGVLRDRNSTRLNSSHGYISYAVFCLKKKKTHDVVDKRM